MRNNWRISHLEYLHVDLRRLAFRTLFEAVTDAFTKESEQQVDSTMALAICENRLADDLWFKDGEGKCCFDEADTS